MTPAQKTLFVLAIAIAGVLALAILTRTHPLDPAAVGFSVREGNKDSAAACAKEPYTGCISCCQNQTDATIGKEQYGRPVWSDAYNQCWEQFCK